MTALDEILLYEADEECDDVTDDDDYADCVDDYLEDNQI